MTKKVPRKFIHLTSGEEGGGTSDGKQTLTPEASERERERSVCACVMCVCKREKERERERERDVVSG